MAMNERDALSKHFLQTCNWGAARRAFLAGDASDRSYERLFLNNETAVLMNAPAGKGDDPADFVRIAKYLLSLGLSAPKVLAEDLTNGFLLLEDLGDDTYARLIEADAQLTNTLYGAAIDVLVHIQAQPAPQMLPDLSAGEWAEAACFALDWYRFSITGERISTEIFRDTLIELLCLHANGPRVTVLRDFHAENLLWLPSRAGLAKVGLLDFQLAQMGQPGYDLVSLLQDARRDVPISAEAAMIRRFAISSGITDFSASYATLGAQRALRILGVFAKLCLTAGKPRYVSLIPRVWGQLQRNLQNPALGKLETICTELLPVPTTAALNRIKEQCGSFP